MLEAELVLPDMDNAEVTLVSDMLVTSAVVRSQ